jgi:methyltransferase
MIPILDREAESRLLELNAASLESASKTVRENDLGRQVKLVEVTSEETPLLDVISAIDLESGYVRRLIPETVADPLFRDVPFTFSLCNPPFYASAEEMQASTELKAFPTYAVRHT